MSDPDLEASDAETPQTRARTLRALGQMAAGVAHEFKNLLNPLGLHVELLDRALAATALMGRLRRLPMPALAVTDADDLNVTVSIGMASLRPDDTLDALVERADQRMYWMKRTGEMPAISSA